MRYLRSGALLLAPGADALETAELVKSEIGPESGKEVTQFHLDAEYQTPDSSAIRTVPIAVSVR